MYFDGELLIGYIGKVHLQLTGGTGGIYGLGVLPASRGKGFGRAILLKAIEKLKSANAKEIMLLSMVDSSLCTAPACKL